VGRRFGQHFLTRKSILERIAAAACGESATLTVEIGPGKGALTECLLALSQRVVAIEVDSYLVHYLRQKFGEAIEAGRLILIEGDVLKTDLGAWGPCVVAGNLPYYIASPILEKVFALRGTWTRAVFLVQAEVAARLTAVPGTREFGYLTAEAQLYSRVELLFPVLRAAFHPPPKVDSAAVRLEPRDPAADYGIDDPAAFLRFCSACFRHKRKTLRNNLTGIYGKERVDRLEQTGLEQTNIEQTSLDQTKLRAEQLSVAQLAALYRRLESSTSGKQIPGAVMS
jgi:16S rRNA (adenine1518-N6/adenine1519-N6)-dimethyltransferase